VPDVSTWLIVVIVIVAPLVALVVYDLVQTRHAILRNFPLIGHLRYVLELVGPELRQYIVTDNDEERPFSRDQRRYVYASAKLENTYFGFGTDNRLEEASGYVVIRQSALPHPGRSEGLHDLPCAKVLGEASGRPGAFRPGSVVNVSAMSFGSLSGAAVEALNRGAAIGGFLHNTGEGGIADRHLHGGELVFQVGTGYFGCRGPDGAFDMGRLLETIEGRPVRAIEIKLSQGAKPGLGGVLPAAKVTDEIARCRGVVPGVTVLSPNRHTAFDDVAGLVDFVERIAEATGLPVGIKSAVGERDFWIELADVMATHRAGPDFVTIDGGEGGTGAGPLVFADHVALPLRLGLAEVFGVFAERQLQERVVFIASGKLGFAQEALVAMALGADCINIAREAMLAIGCIQAQRCHTGHCPTGVATQGRWLSRGLDPTSKSHRVAITRPSSIRAVSSCSTASIGRPRCWSATATMLPGTGPTPRPDAGSTTSCREAPAARSERLPS
jgi:glutamate synthase domain-containing protein 2